MLGGLTQVAVKVLHERDEDRSFAREIAILRSCRHSNVVQFLVRLQQALLVPCTCMAYAQLVLGLCLRELRGRLLVWWLL